MDDDEEGDTANNEHASTTRDHMSQDRWKMQVQHVMQELSAVGAMEVVDVDSDSDLDIVVDSDGATNDDQPGDPEAGKGDDVRAAEGLLPGTPAASVDCAHMTAEELFEHFSRPGEHDLDERQILEALSANGVQESEASIRNMMITFDTDDSGRLDLEEFVKLHKIASVRTNQGAGGGEEGSAYPSRPPIVCT